MAKKSKGTSPEGAPPKRDNAPTKEEFDSFFERLHEVNDRLDADSATHRGDMNSIYEEGAKALGITKEVITDAFKKDRKRVKEEKKYQKADTRTRDSLLLLAQSYGEESPLGQWAKSMADAAGAGAASTAAGK